MILLIFLVIGINIGAYYIASFLSYTYYRSVISKGIIHENKFINPQGYAFMTAFINIILLALIYGFIFALARFGFLFNIISIENFYGVFYTYRLLVMIFVPLVFITVATTLLGVFMYRKKVFENKHDPIKVVKVLRDFSNKYAIGMYILVGFPMIGYYNMNYLDIQGDAIERILNTKDPVKINKCFTKIDKEKIRNERKEELRKQIDKAIDKYVSSGK